MAADNAGDQGENRIRLRLFVGGASPRSLRAIAAVRAACDAGCSGRYELDVIDVYRNPLAARSDQIVAVPTLVKLAPQPKRLFIGDMSDIARLTAGLGLVLPV